MPQTPLGFALQSLPLSRSRAAFRRPRASLRVRPRLRGPARECKVCRDRFPPCADLEPHGRVPKGPTARQQDRERDFPRSFTASLSSARVTPRVDLDQSLEAACPPRESPRASTSTTDLHTRARRLSAVPPASKLCSPRESVHAVFARSLELSPELMGAHRADALLGFALLKPSPPRPRVRSTARNPGEPVLPGRPRSAPDG